MKNKILFSLLLSLPVALLPVRMFGQDGATAELEASDAKVEFYDTVIAAVNGEPIVLSEVVMDSQQEESRLFAMLSGRELEDAVVAVRRRTVDQLINRKLIRQEFDPSEYAIDSQVVESALDEWSASINCKTRIELERWARRNRTSVAEMKQRILEYLIEQYVLFKQYTIAINVTPRDTYEYFKENMDKYSKSETIHLYTIFLSSIRSDYNEICEKLKQLIHSDPKSFRDLAAAYTDGPFRGNSGDLGWLERSQLREIFAAALSGDIAAETAVGPVIAPEGTYFLYVAEYKPREEANYLLLEKQIREEFEAAARKEVYEKYVKKLREKALIRYF